MKKLFALLLALCLMCGVASAGAEDDWEFFIEDPSDEATSRGYATPFISFEVPVEWEEMKVVASGENEVSFETVYTTVYKDNPVSLIVRIVASKNGATRTYEELKEGVHAQYKEIETEEGIRILLVQSTNNYVVYNTFLGGVRLTIAATTGTSQQLGINMAFMDTFFNEVVYPVILSAELPDGTTIASAVATEAADADAAAEAEAKAMEGRIKVGNCNFALPEGLTETERSTESFYEAATCDSENYSLMLISVDYRELGLPVNAIANDYQYTHMYWALQLFLGMEAEEAYDVLTEAISIDMQNGERLLAGATNNGIGVLTHYYRGETFVIVIIAPGDAADSAIGAALEMAMSFRLDGVSEEQMAAAAEAARIAAEQAAMQKYIVITNSSANIRSGPGGDYAKVTTARQGDTFPLIGEDGNWYIIDVNGQTGYVTKGLSAIQ